MVIAGFGLTLGCGHAGPGSDLALADGGVVPADDFSISLNPTTRTTPAGTAIGFGVTTAITAGIAQKVNLSISGLPATIVASFNLSAIDSGGSAVVTLTPSSTTAAGLYNFTITGTGTTATHSIAGSVTVAAASSDFTMSLSPITRSIAANTSTTYSVVTRGSAPAVNLSISGLPTGIAASFSPTSVIAGRNSILTLRVGRNVAHATYTFTVTGKAGSATRTAAGTITVH
jgi:uncharacterized membrane protein